MTLSNKKYYSFNDNKTVPIVFIHGVGLDRSMWKPQIKFFKNYSIITYDLLGHGKSPFYKEKINIDDFKNQLKSLLEYLNVESFHLVGFSIGSLISINLAAEMQNKIKSLTLISTTYKRSDKQRQEVIDRVNLAKLNKPISKLALKRWFTDKYLEENPNTYEKISSILEKNNMEDFIKVYELFVFHKNDEKFENIKVNTLVITGEKDIGSTVDMSKKLCNVINNSQLKVIKNGKHLCGIECADDVNMTIKNFIEKND